MQTCQKRRRKKAKIDKKGLTVDVFREGQVRNCRTGRVYMDTKQSPHKSPKEAKMEFGTTLDVSP